MSDAIRRNFCQLCDELRPLNEVWNHLKQDEIFEDDDIEQADSKPTPLAKAVETIRRLQRKGPSPHGDPCERFIHILHQCHFSHLADKLQQTISTECTPQHDTAASVLHRDADREEECKIRIRKKFTHLVQRLDPSHLLQSHLYSNFVMELEDFERIECERSTMDKAKKLLQIVRSCPNRNLCPSLVLMAGLELTKQTYLVNDLNEERASAYPITDPQDAMLKGWLQERFEYQSGSQVTLAVAMNWIKQKCRQEQRRNVFKDMQVVNVLRWFSPDIRFERLGTSHDAMFLHNLTEREQMPTDQPVSEVTTPEDYPSGEETFVKQPFTSEEETQLKTVVTSTVDIEGPMRNHDQPEIQDQGMDVVDSSGVAVQQTGIPKQNAKMQDWTVDEVCSWLKHLRRDGRVRIPDVAITAFKEEDIDGLALTTLTIEQLRLEFASIKLGPRQRIIMSRDAHLQSEQSSAPIDSEANALSRSPETPAVHVASISSSTESKPQLVSPSRDTLGSEMESPTDGISPVEHADGANMVSTESIPRSGSVQEPFEENASCVHVSEERFNESFRTFDEPVGIGEKYKRYSQLPLPEARPANLLSPIHRYIEVDLAKMQKTVMVHVMQEIIKFAAVCLNDRTNGTIHLGVTSKGVIKGTKLARSIDDLDKTVEQGLQKSFFPDQHLAVLSCIRPLKLVEVLPNEGQKLYVIEIDVVPSWEICQAEAFFVKMPYLDTQGALSFQDAELYRLEQMEPVAQNAKQVLEFMGFKLKISNRRREVEQERYIQPENKETAKQFSNILCLEYERIDVYRVLVVNAPTKCDDYKAFFDANLKFISLIDWKVVLDFDPEAHLCRYMDEDLHEHIRVITSPNEFNPNSPKNKLSPERLKHLHEDILQGGHTPWIFANGHVPSNVPGVDEPIDWNRNHSQAFSEAVRFICAQIPDGRAVITFLLLSKEYDVMLEAADCLCKGFPDQWLFMAETSNITNPWVEKLQQRNVIDRQSIDSHVITGIPWGHLQEILEHIQINPSFATCFLPTSYGKYVALDERIRHDITDLAILSSKECDTDEEDEDKIAARKREEEEAFYHGRQVSWWNFWFADQVLQRDIHDQLRRTVEDRLTGITDAGEAISITYLYHQPGAGGTTSARHILWELRKNYRCAVIRNISEDTIKQIMKLREHSDNRPKPVLLLLDNHDEEGTVPFLVTLEEECKRLILNASSIRAICVILVCSRVSKLRHGLQQGRHFLKQELTTRERTWFQTTHRRLADNYQKDQLVNPKYLISFNIMRQNFEKSFIKACVDQFLKEIDSEKERLLLKYIALVSAFQLEKEPVPTAAFDLLMIDNPYKKRGLRYGRAAIADRWENNLSDGIRVLLNETSSQGMGIIKALSIINSLMSRVILENMSPSDSRQSVSSVAMEFLRNPDIFGATSIATSRLLDIVKDLMKRRERGPDGYPRTKFAPLVQEIVDNETIGAACDLLQCGLSMTNDPFIAQQLTRLYIHSQDWKMAEEYAKRAVNLLHPKRSSFLLDTLGQVYKGQLMDTYTSCLHVDKNLPLEIGARAISLTKSAVHNFKLAQTANDEDSWASFSNLAGFHGELESIILLLDCLTYIESLRLNRVLKQFLNEDFVPEDLDVWRDDDGVDLIAFVKQLKVDVDRCLNRLEDEGIQLREEIPGDYKLSRKANYYGKLRKLKESVIIYFGEQETLSDANSEEMDEAAICKYNRRRLLYINGTSLHSIFSLKQKEDGERQMEDIQKIALQNVTSCHQNAQDLLTLLGVNLALFFLCPHKYLYKINYDEMIAYSRTLYEKRNLLPNIQLEPYLFYVMLNWPTKNRDKCDSPKAIKEAIRQWRLSYIDKYPRQQIHGNTIRKKDTTIFFLANGSQMNSVVSQDELTLDEYNTDRHNFWRRPHVLRRLQRFCGWLCGDGTEVLVNVKYHGGTDTMSLATSFPITQRNMWNKKVFFVIGFSWAGPKAFDVDAEDPTEDPSRLSEGHQVQQYDQNRTYTRQPDHRSFITHSDFRMQVSRVERKLKEIERLKDELHTTKRKPKQAEMRLLSEEDRLQKRKVELIKKRAHDARMFDD